jgi:hypothetical protein
MTGLYLVFMGILLIFGNAPILGIFALVAGICAAKKNVSFWAILLGIFAMFGGWFWLGLIAVILGIVED